MEASSPSTEKLWMDRKAPSAKSSVCPWAQVVESVTSKSRAMRLAVAAMSMAPMRVAMAFSFGEREVKQPAMRAASDPVVCSSKLWMLAVARSGSAGWRPLPSMRSLVVCESARSMSMSAPFRLPSMLSLLMSMRSGRLPRAGMKAAKSAGDM